MNVHYFFNMNREFIIADYISIKTSNGFGIGWGLGSITDKQ